MLFGRITLSSFGAKHYALAEDSVMLFWSIGCGSCLPRWDAGMTGSRRRGIAINLMKKREPVQ